MLVFILLIAYNSLVLQRSLFVEGGDAEVFDGWLQLLVVADVWPPRRWMWDDQVTGCCQASRLAKESVGIAKRKAQVG